MTDRPLYPEQKVAIWGFVCGACTATFAAMLVTGFGVTALCCPILGFAIALYTTLYQIDQVA